MKLSIIIPCYNEAANLPTLLEAYNSVITRSDIEIILVNNGSTDETAEILTDLAVQYTHFLRVHTVSDNQGYGHGILAGLKEARGNFLGWTHGDLQTSPADVVRALDIIEGHSDAPNLYVKGNRQGRPLFDRFFTGGMSLFETLYLRTIIRDTNAQPNVFHRSFFESWEHPPSDFSLDLYVLYTATQHQLNIIRFPVNFPERQHGESKWNTSWKAKWKFIKRTIQFSIELKQRLKHTNETKRH